MSHTPRFDEKITAIIRALPEGKDAEICRKFQVPPLKMDWQKQLHYLQGFNTGLAFFWKPHVETGKPLLSAVHPDHPIPVVSEEEWASADYTRFGRDIDAQDSVINQIWSLVTVVPHNPTRSVNAINSVAVGSINTQDCFCACGSFNINRCRYVYAVADSEDCIDAANGTRLARSYQSGGSNELSDCQFVYDSKSCLNSSFLFDCWNCDSCFGATNQRNKRFVFFNEQLTEEDYKERLRQIDLGDANVAKAYLEKFMELWRQEGVWPEAFRYGNTESTGERVIDCVRCTDGFWQGSCVDCFRCRFGGNNNGCAYTSGEAYEQDCYLCTGGSFGARNKFCAGGSKCISCEYCHNMRDCENCFACVGLQHKKFCILNKQYTEEEYWPLVDELKCKMLDEGEYGEFFPAKFSPCGFQYSAGELYIGYSEEQLAEYGAPTFDPRRGQLFAPASTEAQTMEAADLPMRLDATELPTFLGKAIHDAELDRNFTILPDELEVYKAKRWPLPRRHFVSRLKDLVRITNSPTREEATCESCQESITTYKNFTFPERKVYCNACYLKYLETR